MAAVGGSIVRVAIKGRTFAVAADADATRSLGGYTNAVEANGDGTARLLKTREPWSITGLTLSCDSARADQEYLQDIKNGDDFVPMSVEHADGSVYAGTGQITDKTEFSSGKATCGVSLSGPNKLEQQ